MQAACPAELLLTTDVALASLVSFLQIQAVLLSRNSLTSLQGIQQFAAARTVSLAANLLESYDDLAPLIRGCPALEALSLEGNPLSALPNYRCLGRHACQGGGMQAQAVQTPASTTAACSSSNHHCCPFWPMRASSDFARCYKALDASDNQGCNFKVS